MTGQRFSFFRPLLHLWLAAVPLAGACAAAQPDFAIPDGTRLLMLGDSITHAGDYISYLEAYQFTRHSDRRIEVIAIGLGSETISGLSENDHPFPRPDAHERLERALDRVQPTHVTACYGMNDGIYHPFSEERFARFQDGIRRLSALCRQRGLPLTLLTPPPFDASAPDMAGKVVGADHPAFGYKTPYRGYDQVLTRYGAWLLARPAGPAERTADPHGELTAFLTARRQQQPGYFLAKDGIHPGPTGHLMIALALLKSWNGPIPLPTARLQARQPGGAGPWQATWKTPLPMPRDPRWSTADLEALRFHETFNRSLTAIEGLPAGRWQVLASDRVLGEWEAAALREGVDLMARPATGLQTEADALFAKIHQRRQLLGDAWRQHVGHRRPGIAPAPALEEAESKAAALEKETRAAAEPREILLSFIPAPGTGP